MPAPFGERLDDNASPAGQYWPHPAAGSGWLADGQPLDAGSAMIIDQNLSHLSFESLRHLAWDLGFGNVKGSGTGWSGVSDGQAQPSGTPPTEAEIAWSVATSRRYGPFVAIADRQLSTGGLGPRTVRAKVRAAAGATNSLKLYLAMTASEATPDQGYIQLATGLPGTGTPVTGTYDLTPAVELTSPLVRWPCRADAAHGPVACPLQVFWLWIGWKSTDAADAIVSVSFFETRS